MEQWREDVLIHYGVKGMKWRHRKKSNMSDLERVSRAAEGAYKRYKELEKARQSKKAIINTLKISNEQNKKRRKDGMRTWDEIKRDVRLDKELKDITQRMVQEFSNGKGMNAKKKIRSAYDKIYGKGSYQKAKELGEASIRKKKYASKIGDKFNKKFGIKIKF